MEKVARFLEKTGELGKGDLRETNKRTVFFFEG